MHSIALHTIVNGDGLHMRMGMLTSGFKDTSRTGWGHNEDTWPARVRIVSAHCSGSWYDHDLGVGAANVNPPY